MAVAEARRVKMLSRKLFTCSLFFIIFGLGVAAYDKLDSTEFKTQLNKVTHQQKTNQASNSNFVADFFVRYFSHWAVYLTELSSSLHGVVCDIMFRLQDSISSFPLTAVETFSVISICLLFLLVIIMFKLLERQIGRVIALEQENARLNENNKMNRILLNEVMAENRKPLMDGVNDAVRKIQEKENMFMQTKVSLQKLIHKMGADTSKLNLRVQEVEKKYREQSLRHTNVDQSENNNSTVDSVAAGFQNCVINGTNENQNLEKTQKYQSTCTCASEPEAPQQQEDTDSQVNERYTDCQETEQNEVSSARINENRNLENTQKYQSIGTCAPEPEAAQQEEDSNSQVNERYTECQETEQNEASSARTNDVTGGSTAAADQTIAEGASELTSDVIYWYINQLVYSCNTSYIRTKRLEQSNAEMIWFVDDQCRRILHELDHLARSQERLTDMVYSQLGTYV